MIIKLKKNNKELGTVFIIVILLLMALSVITLASLSSPRSLSDSNGKDALHFVKLQGWWFVIGIGVFFGVSKIDYRKYRKKWFSNGLYSIGAILLSAVLVIGQSVNVFLGKKAMQASLVNTSNEIKELENRKSKLLDQEKNSDENEKNEKYARNNLNLKKEGEEVYKTTE